MPSAHFRTTSISLQISSAASSSMKGRCGTWANVLPEVFAIFILFVNTLLSVTVTIRGSDPLSKKSLDRECKLCLTRIELGGCQRRSFDVLLSVAILAIKRPNCSGLWLVFACICITGLKMSFNEEVGFSVFTFGVYSSAF